MIDAPYSIYNVVREIEYDISYLEDAPDEILAPYLGDLETVGERLRKLKECLSKRINLEPIKV